MATSESVGCILSTTCQKVACNIIFHIFGVKDLSFIHRNVIYATCKEIVIHQQSVAIATDKHHCTRRIRSYIHTTCHRYTLQ